MKDLKKRALAFESQFAHNHQQDFLITLKACRILARYVAEERLQMKKSAVERYCDRIVSLSVQNCNLDTMFDYIQKRLKRNKIDMSDRELEHHFSVALDKARLDLA